MANRIREGWGMVIAIASMMAVSVGWLSLLFFKGFEAAWLQRKWLRISKRAEPWPLRFFNRRRKLEAIRLELPFIMDLLAVSVQAGMDWIQAMQKIVVRHPQSPLVLELKIFLDDLELGKTRREALGALKTRVALEEINQFIALLIQTLKLGSPLAPVLSALASQMRERRLFLIEKLGAQASLKILFPLVFCILPSVFLTLFTPLALRYLL